METTPVPGRTLVASALVPVLVVALLCATLFVTIVQAADARRHADKVVCATVRDAFVDQNDLLRDFLPPSKDTTAFLDALAESVQSSYVKCVARIG